MIILLSVLVCVIGLVIYIGAKPENPKLAEVGRLMFFTGLLAFLLQTPAIVALLKR